MRPVHLVPLLLVFTLGIPHSFGNPTARHVQLAPAPKSQVNNETDPQKQQLFGQRPAQAIETRIEARLLASLGRQSQNPLPLIAAAQLFEQSPLPRPLQQVTPPTEENPVPAAGDGPPTVLDSPEPQDLLSEARALALAQPEPLRKQLLVLLDQIARAEIVVRGAVLGPQQVCDGLTPGVKLIYNILYEGSQKAVLALSGTGPGALHITVSDDRGNVVARAPDRTLVAWYPRWQGVFRVEIENHTPDRLHFCMETN